MSKKKSFFLSTPFLAMFACLLWSSAFAFIKIGLQYSKPFSFAGMRFMLAGLILIPAWFKNRPKLCELKKAYKSIIYLSLIQTFFLYTSFYFAMMFVSGALTAITIGINPLLAAIIAHFMIVGESLSFKKIISIFIGMAGIIIISLSRYSLSKAGIMESIGIVILLASGCISVFANIMVLKNKHFINPICLNSIQIGFGGFLIFIFSLFVEGIPKITTYPIQFFISLCWLAFVSATAFSIWFVLLKRENAKVSTLNIWKFIIPLFGSILSWLLLPNESPSIPQLSGMLLIASSIFMFYKQEKIMTTVK